MLMKLAAFVASEIAQPLLNSIGNGWLYTMWTFIQVSIVTDHVRKYMLTLAVDRRFGHDPNGVL